MAVLFTIDASVFVAACRAGEPFHAAARQFLRRVREVEAPMIEPAILPVEIAASLARTGSDARTSCEYAEAVMALPYLTMPAVDNRLARRAISVAARCLLRSADALYAAVALQYGACMVTLDKEQLARAPKQIHACTPDRARVAS